MTKGKVLIVGAGEAGKSTLIGALCPNAVNLEVRGRTVGFDHGMLRRAGDVLSVVGVPGQGRFAAVRESLSKAVLLAVWVHRAGEIRCVETEALVAELAVPYVFFINHHGTVDDHRASVPVAAGLRPSAVLWGDLHHPRQGLLEEIEDAIWALARDPAGSL